MRILCVCLGNICRSPLAEDVVRARLGARATLVDSAGTGTWHLGKPPDSRSQAAAKARGYDLSGQLARHVTDEDFARFDLILAMDQQNLRDLRAIAPEGARAALRLLHPRGIDIPDPYYGGRAEFETALDLIEDAVDALARDLARP